MNDNKMEYQTPQFMPMTDFELQSVNGGGIPVVVFILVIRGKVIYDIIKELASKFMVD